jgi:hypothetical protein
MSLNLKKRKRETENKKNKKKEKEKDSIGPNSTLPAERELGLHLFPN